MVVVVVAKRSEAKPERKVQHSYQTSLKSALLITKKHTMFSVVAKRQQLLLVVACLAALLANSVAFARKAEYYYNSVTGEVCDDMHFPAL